MIAALACGVDGIHVDDRIECFISEQEFNKLCVTSLFNDSVMMTASVIAAV